MQSNHYAAFPECPYFCETRGTPSFSGAPERGMRQGYGSVDPDETRSFIAHRKCPIYNVSYRFGRSIMPLRLTQHGTGLRPFPTCRNHPNCFGESWPNGGRVGKCETHCATPVR